MSDLRLLQQLTDTLDGFPEAELAVLFGSAARRTMSHSSDIDLAVRLTDDTPESRRRIGNAVGRAVQRDVDLLSVDTLPPQLRFEIARDGIPLVERRSYAWADFQVRAMLDWWEWAPIARRIHAGAVERLRKRQARGPS